MDTAITLTSWRKARCLVTIPSSSSSRCPAPARPSRIGRHASAMDRLPATKHRWGLRLRLPPVRAQTRQLLPLVRLILSHQQILRQSRLLQHQVLFLSPGLFQRCPPSRSAAHPSMDRPVRLKNMGNTGKVLVPCPIKQRKLVLDTSATGRKSGMDLNRFSSNACTKYINCISRVVSGI